MTRFVVRRLIQSVLLVFAVMTLSFFLIHLTPGGPEAALMQNPRVSAETHPADARSGTAWTIRCRSSTSSG